MIIGGSLGGLFAGNLLHDLGWEVDIYERVPDDLASRGAGIGTHQELLAVLAELGIEMEERLGGRGGAAGIGTHQELLAVLAELGIEMEERLGAESGDRVCLDAQGNEVHRSAWGH